MTELKNRILQLLNEYNIPYSTYGKNIGRKAIAGIDCPFCGNDTGKHLGIMGTYFTCWKNKRHSGNIFYLFSVLLGLPINDVRTLFLDGETEPTTENQRELGKKEEISFPKEFRKIENRFPTTIFFNYLQGRGFDEGCISKYNLMCCIEGEWKNRIIIPVFFKGKLVSWQGRTISTLSSTPRYKSLSIEYSVRGINYCLWNFDNLNGGRYLYITEGPFDAMKIDYYTDADATCLFTANISPEQEELLLTIAPKYDIIIILLDNDAFVQSYKLYERISYIGNVLIRYLPERRKDAAEMSKEEIISFIGEIGEGSYCNRGAFPRVLS